MTVQLGTELLDIRGICKGFSSFFASIGALQAGYAYYHLMSGSCAAAIDILLHSVVYYRDVGFSIRGEWETYDETIDI